jgi:hypothetical protein
MARQAKGARPSRPSRPEGQVTQERVREIVSAIAAEVIAETAERLSGTPRRKAAALRMATRRRAARKPA